MWCILLLAIFVAQAFAKAPDSLYYRPGPWDDPHLDTLIEANRRWSSRVKQTNPDVFESAKIGHAPKILWIGCSDARVPVNEIIGEPPGGVFVHRNIANCVVNTDFNLMSVLQYAVDVLHVRHIVVCGHYDCGGVKASLEPVDHKAPLENWLRNIKDVHRLHQDELSSITDTKARQRRLVELNVIEQCLNIYKTAAVQRRRVQTHLEKSSNSKLLFTEPRVHAFVYDPLSGELKRLQIDFKQYLSDLSDVYNMYTIDAMKSTTVKEKLDEKLDAKFDNIPLLSSTEIEDIKDEIEDIREQLQQLKSITARKAAMASSSRTGTGGRVKKAAY